MRPAARAHLGTMRSGQDCRHGSPQHKEDPCERAQLSGLAPEDWAEPFPQAMCSPPSRQPAYMTSQGLHRYNSLIVSFKKQSVLPDGHASIRTSLGPFMSLKATALCFRAAPVHTTAHHRLGATAGPASRPRRGWNGCRRGLWPTPPQPSN